LYLYASCLDAILFVVPCLLDDPVGCYSDSLVIPIVVLFD
jgi:hypothetical protein